MATMSTNWPQCISNGSKIDQMATMYLVVVVGTSISYSGSNPTIVMYNDDNDVKY
jgi:hypothetical protein